MTEHKKITIADIAREAGVSTMTVSRYLSGSAPVAKETGERIRKIIEKLGYQPNYLARGLSSKRSMILGVTIPRTEHVLMDNYLAQVLSGITDVAQTFNYRVILLPFDPAVVKNDHEFVNLFKSKLVDGLILLKTLHGDPRIKALAEAQIPFILVNHKYYSNNVNFVDVKNMQGMQQAVEFLYKKGHRKIAFITGDLRETNARDRLNGFKKTMKKLALPIREEWIIQGQFQQKTAYQKSTCLFEGAERPTAVIASDDYMAIGVIQQAREHGLQIPKDLAVVGFDDIELARFFQPSLTTIRQPLLELGHMATEALLKIINKSQTIPVHRLLNVKLIERESA